MHISILKPQDAYVEDIITTKWAGTILWLQQLWIIIKSSLCCL